MASGNSDNYNFVYFQQKKYPPYSIKKNIEKKNSFSMKNPVFNSLLLYITDKCSLCKKYAYFSVLAFKINDLGQNSVIIK